MADEKKTINSEDKNVSKTQQKNTTTTAKVVEPVKAEEKSVAAKKTATADKKETVKPVAEKKETVKASVAEKKEPAKTTTKSAAEKTETKKTTTKPAAEKKATTTAKKTATKSSTTKKTTTKKTTAKAEKKERLFVEYLGVQVEKDTIVDKVKSAWQEGGNKVSDIKTLDLYVQPETNKVYYVINEEIHGDIEFN